MVSICNTNNFPQGIIAGPDGNIWTIESINVAVSVAPCTETDYPLSVDYGYTGMTSLARITISGSLSRIQ